MKSVKATDFISGIEPFRHVLKRHPIYGAIQTLEDIRAFMSHHVYCVWDFMCLLKALQKVIAPSGYPWDPTGNPSLRRLIGEIVLSEECDELPPNSVRNAGHASHFELYCLAMSEVGADTNNPLSFVRLVHAVGIDEALRSDIVPDPVREFMSATFRIIRTEKSHVIAAAFALGREDAVPYMFQSLLREMKVGTNDAPMFHYYVKRHIEIDGDTHGPLASMMLDILCNADPIRIQEAKQAAADALTARIRLWDSIYALLRNRPEALQCRTWDEQGKQIEVELSGFSTARTSS